MQIILQDKTIRHQFFPFTHTRHTAEMRMGIFTIKEKWKNYFTATVFFDDEKPTTDAIVIDANLLPTDETIHLIQSGKYDASSITQSCKKINRPWEIIQLNHWAIEQDFKWIKANRTSHEVSSTNKLIQTENIFIEAGVQMEYCILNASKGPIYIGKNCEVMEGSMIRGPFAMNENSVLKMGSKIYGATTLGPNCLAGGEIKNSVLFGNSNKAHDGYLGDSVIGEWCNLGAGTSNSNLKNTAGEINIWYEAESQWQTAGNKCGLMMGDYCYAAINSRFNTGTVAGVCCNIFSNEILPKFIPHFSFGNELYEIEKAFIHINNWKKLKNHSITDKEKLILQSLYNQKIAS